MKNYYFLILGLFWASIGSFTAQTYATDSLKLSAEKEATAKNLRLGIKSINEVERPVNESFVRFNYAALSKGYYKLSSVEVVDYSKKYSKAEMEAYALEGEDEFLLNDMVLDLTKNTMYFIQRSSGRYRTIELDKKGTVFYIKNCKTCQDAMYTIILQDEKHLVLEVKGQDERVIYFQYFLTSTN